jgi:Domain of unknown function (DUF5615)
VKILFDHNVPRRLRNHLEGHEIHTAKEMQWEQLKNGALIAAAIENGFQAFVTIDKQLEYQQNLAALLLPVVVLDAKSNTLLALLPFVAFLRDLFASSLERVLYVIDEDGKVLALKQPRTR